MKLPTGTGTPAPDIRDAIVEATTACQSVRSLSAEIGVSGSVGKQGLRGRLPDRCRLARFCTYRSGGAIRSAGFYPGCEKRRRDVAVAARSADSRTRQAGGSTCKQWLASLSTRWTLRRALVGCGAALDGDAARAIGDDWRVVPDGPDEAYLHRDARSGPWRIVAIVHKRKDGPAWRAEYKDFRQWPAAQRAPRRSRIRSAPGAVAGRA
jgi:hypothetical protein